MAEKKKGGIGIDPLISWGATIVIIGLMFKLMNWEWGDWMIVIGLGTEAILFLLLGFQALNQDKEDAEVVKEPRHVNGNTAALDSMFKHAEISPDAIANLGTGLRKFSDTVGSISNVADASIATSEFTGKLRSANTGFDKFNDAFEKASSDLATIGTSRVNANAYYDQMQRLSENLESLNTIYESELKDSGSRLKSVSSHYTNIEETLKSLNESATETKAFQEQVSELNKNLASLNAVYGNMLAAMNQPRV